MGVADQRFVKLVEYDLNDCAVLYLVTNVDIFGALAFAKFHLDSFSRILPLCMFELVSTNFPVLFNHRFLADRPSHVIAL